MTINAENSIGSDEQTLSLTITANNKTKSVYPNEIYNETINYDNYDDYDYIVDYNYIVDDYDSMNEDYFVIAELDEISVDVSGMYDFVVNLSDDVDYDGKLIWIAGSDKYFDDDLIAEFSDSEGKEINSIPENKIINISVWLNEGRIYNPKIAVK